MPIARRPATASAHPALKAVLFQPSAGIGAISAEYNEVSTLTVVAPKKGNACATLQHPQADALSLTGRPFSFIRPCNSPAWNISRTISQPPTNSPLT